jgi:hypothetical protein
MPMAISTGIAATSSVIRDTGSDGAAGPHRSLTKRAEPATKSERMWGRRMEAFACLAFYVTLDVWETEDGPFIDEGLYAAAAALDGRAPGGGS